MAVWTGYRNYSVPLLSSHEAESHGRMIECCNIKHMHKILVSSSPFLSAFIESVVMMLE